jgi:hypothetical protein
MQKQESKPFRIVLSVPFSEKDDAKALGAQWNPEIKKWYAYSNNPHIRELCNRWE